MLVSSRRGFSLIELMIVVAIVAVLAAVAAPAFRETLATTRMKTLASDIHLSLARARSEAIKRNANITVAATGGNWLAGWTVSSGVETHGAVSGDSVAVSGTSTITYAPSGRVTTGSVAINLSSSDVSTLRCVTVNLSGNPTIKDSACP